MSMKQDVRTLFIGRGMTAGEIETHFNGALKSNTIRRYILEITQSMSPDEIETRRKAKESKVVVPKPRFLDRKPSMSPIHMRVGAKMGWHRQKSDLNPGAYAEKHGFGNRQSIRLMEQGSYDFTVSDLHRIAEILEVTFEELLTPPIVRFVK